MVSAPRLPPVDGGVFEFLRCTWPRTGGVTTGGKPLEWMVKTTDDENSDFDSRHTCNFLDYHLLHQYRFLTIHHAPLSVLKRK